MGKAIKVLWRARFKSISGVDISKQRATSIYCILSHKTVVQASMIVQEVVLANEVAIHCGESSIPWNTFELALTELFENDKGGFSDEHRTTLWIMCALDMPN